MQKQHGKNHGSNRLNGRENAADDAAHNPHAGLIETEGTYGADENDNSHIEKQNRVDENGDIPGPKQSCQGAAANEHSPADDDNEVELLHKPVRLYGVNDKGGSTDQTPDECLRCDGQALRVEVGCACKGTGNNQQDAQCFIKPGQSLFFGQRVEQNHGWGGVGQHGSQGHIRILNGRIVSVLAERRAQQTKD